MADTEISKYQGGKPRDATLAASNTKDLDKISPIIPSGDSM